EAQADIGGSVFVGVQRVHMSGTLGIRAREMRAAFTHYPRTILSPVIHRRVFGESGFHLACGLPHRLILDFFGGPNPPHPFLIQPFGVEPAGPESWRTTDRTKARGVGCIGNGELYTEQPSNVLDEFEELPMGPEHQTGVLVPWPVLPEIVPGQV